MTHSRSTTASSAGGPWSVYEHKPPALHHTYLHGEPTAVTMIGAETHVSPIVVELLQPVDGPSIYKEWFEEHGEGLHLEAAVVLAAWLA